MSAASPYKIANPTPMMRQYMAAKDAHPDAMLLFRMGDFYELFFEDAVEASRILELTLTSRNKKDDTPIPMAGVPYHALDSYLPKLVSAGKKVAICEQVEDPRQAKGIVRREVTRVVTPGVILDASALDKRVPNFLAAIFRVAAGAAGEVGLAWVDVSTGERRGAELPSVARALEEIARVEPREVLYDGSDTAVSAAVKQALPRVTLSPVRTPDAPASVLAGAAAMLGDYVGETRTDSA
ncbi:MAG: DNA mismatch repair protein MutS, partial [Myxococcota bacterium]